MSDKPCHVLSHFEASSAALAETLKEQAFIESCRQMTAACVRTLKGGGKLLFAGNGGSAGDAQHIAGEFVSRLNFDRAPLAAIALTVDTSVLTAVGNDYGFDRVFERQVLALGRKGDLFCGISTSGRSPNILRALRAARELGVTTVGLMGANGGEMADLCDLVLAAPHTRTPMIQQLHITAAHAICGAVEEEIFGGPAA